MNPGVATPFRLHKQAHAEHPDDPDAAGKRYVELMREAGHITRREPGDDAPLLPCGFDPRPRRPEPIDAEDEYPW